MYAVGISLVYYRVKIFYHNDCDYLSFLKLEVYKVLNWLTYVSTCLFVFGELTDAIVTTYHHLLHLSIC